MDLKFMLNITVRKTEEKVFFKPDGQRFAKPMTVKLNADKEYSICLYFRPALQLHNLLINGVVCELVEKKGVVEDEDLTTYTAIYKTLTDDVNKNGKRKDLFFTVECENGVSMNFAVQCKVYKAVENSHAHWGQKLSTINMDCKMNVYEKCITVLNEKYF